MTPTPLMDDLELAASKLEFEPALVRYHLMQYAAKSIEDMVNKGWFIRLAEMIVQDKQSLKIIFREGSEEQIETRRMIVLAEKEWFKRLGINGRSLKRDVYSIATEKPIRKIEQVFRDSESSL